MKKIFLILALFFSPLVHAAWQIIPDKSELTFTATQNNAPVTGKFSNFNGKIDFDPNQLNSSQVEINIDMNSVSASYGEVADTLKTPDWFNVKIFPTAVFKANRFKKITDNKFQANGSLTIRNKTIPVILIFELNEFSPTQAKAKGYTTLKRLMFGVGQGDWASTDEIKNEVQVNFTITATKR